MGANSEGMNSPWGKTSIIHLGPPMLLIIAKLRDFDQRIALHHYELREVSLSDVSSTEVYGSGYNWTICL